MEQEYLEIKEFAKRADKSFQGIYKRVNNSNSKLQPFVKYFEGSPKIHKRALVELYGVEEEVEKVEEKVERIVEKVEEGLNEEKDGAFAIELVGALKEEIELLKKELNNKEEQLKKKDTQIEELFALMKEHNKILDQQQQLSAMDKNKIFKLESKEQKAKRVNIFTKWFSKKGLEIEEEK